MIDIKYEIMKNNRNISNHNWSSWLSSFRKDLLPTVTELVENHSEIFHVKLSNHPNPIIISNVLSIYIPVNI